MQNKKESDLDKAVNWKFWYILIIITNLVFITFTYQYFTHIS